MRKYSILIIIVFILLFGLSEDVFAQIYGSGSSVRGFNSFQNSSSRGTGMMGQFNSYSTNIPDRVLPQTRTSPMRSDMKQSIYQRGIIQASPRSFGGRTSQMRFSPQSRVGLSNANLISSNLLGRIPPTFSGTTLSRIVGPGFRPATLKRVYSPSNSFKVKPDSLGKANDSYTQSLRYLGKNVLSGKALTNNELCLAKKDSLGDKTSLATASPIKAATRVSVLDRFRTKKTQNERRSKRNPLAKVKATEEQSRIQRNTPISERPLR